MPKSTKALCLYDAKRATLKRLLFVAEREGWNGLCRNIPQLSVLIGFKSISALLLLHIILYHSAQIWV